MKKFIPVDEIEKEAIAFLNKYNPDSIIPVQIEEIIEFDLGINLFPIKGLLNEHRIDGFLSWDLTTISIDEDQYLNFPKRLFEKQPLRNRNRSRSRNRKDLAIENMSFNLLKLNGFYQVGVENVEAVSFRFK